MQQEISFYDIDACPGCPVNIREGRFPLVRTAGFLSAGLTVSLRKNIHSQYLSNTTLHLSARENVSRKSSRGALDSMIS